MNIPQDANGNYIINGVAYAADFITYEQDFAGLASGITANSNFNIQQDAFFLWQHATSFAESAHAAVNYSSTLNPLVNIIITDGGTSRQLMTAAVPVPNIFGTAQLPYVLPTPRLFKPTSLVSLQVHNFDAATTYNLYLSFIGLRLVRV